MGSPPLNKAGRDHSQDAELRDLKADILRNREVNEEQHSGMMTKVEAAYERIEGKLTMQRTVAIVVYMILLAAGGYLVDSQTNILRDVSENNKETAQQLQHLQTQHEAWEARAIEWGENLDETDDELKQDIKELRRHQSRHRME
jgi:hypothetical protein